MLFEPLAPAKKKVLESVSEHLRYMYMPTKNAIQPFVIEIFRCVHCGNSQKFHSEHCFFTGTVTTFIYFCSWNDDKNQQSGEWQCKLTMIVI